MTKNISVTISLLMALINLNAQDNRNNYDVNEIFFYSIANGDHVLFMHILENENIDVNFQSQKYNDSTALQIAGEYGNMFAIMKLIEHGANIELRNKNLLNALQIAVYSENYLAAEYLVANGADIESRDIWNRTPLYDATIRGNYNAINFYITLGANMYTYQYDTFNALHVYISQCLGNNRIINKEIIKVYINNGYDANWEDGSKYTLIHSLSMQNDISLFDILRKGTSYDYNRQTIDGVTPLQISIMTHSFNTVIYLLENGANINYQDRYGESVLFWAIRVNDMELIQLLLRFTPNLLLRNNKGETIYDIAAEEIKALL
jgi:ankyrin repeat protein